MKHILIISYLIHSDNDLSPSPTPAPANLVLANKRHSYLLYRFAYRSLLT